MHLVIVPVGLRSNTICLTGHYPESIQDHLCLLRSAFYNLPGHRVPRGQTNVEILLEKDFLYRKGFAQCRKLTIIEEIGA